MGDLPVAALKQDSMPLPDSSNRTPWNRQPLTDGTSAFSLGNYQDVTQVAKALSQLGGGAVALDLALDLVLNQVVEQACLATGATGAAVALMRDGEIVCRATTGEHAPELGMRIETASGLSGECLRTGQLQDCADTESDPRVDPESCRRLGIRSAMLIPLSNEIGPFGILEAFSSRPNAFGERDIHTLEALADRVLASKRAAEEKSNVTDWEGQPESEMPVTRLAPEPERPSATPTPVSMPSPIEKTPEEKLFTANESLLVEEHSAGNDIWTTVLVMLVIGAAVALGVVIGWRGALQGQGSIQPAARTDAPAAATQATPHASTANAPEVSARPVRVPDATKSSRVIPTQAEGRSASGSPASSSGGLTVTENGKVIYRLRAKSIPGDAESSASGEGSGGTRLIHRIDPEYPAEARRKHVQGPVVLDVQVLANGSVGSIEIASGDPLLSEAAVRAVRQWKYQPYVLDGQPAQSQTRITIRFTLPSS